MWCEDRKNNAGAFSDSVIAMLKECFKTERSLQLRKERMWGQYHKLRTSPEHKKLWCDLTLKVLAVPATPTFHQYVTDKVFDQLIKNEFKLKGESQSRGMSH